MAAVLVNKLGLGIFISLVISELLLSQLGCFLLFVHVYRCVGAVAITDCVCWLVLYPFLTSKDYRLNFVSTRLLISLTLRFLIYHLFSGSSQNCLSSYTLFVTRVELLFEFPIVNGFYLTRLPLHSTADDGHKS